MATSYAEFRCTRCNVVVTVTGNKVYSGPDRQELGPCSGGLSQIKDHQWLKIRTYER